MKNRKSKPPVSEASETRHRFDEPQRLREEQLTQSDDEQFRKEFKQARKVLRQDVTLRKTGETMNAALALVDWRILLNMVEQRRELFDALVSLVISEQPLESLPPRTLMHLKAEGLLMPDGSVQRGFATLLKAAYEPAGEDRVPLVYPIIHPTKDHAKDLEAACEIRDLKILRKALGIDKDQGRGLS